MLCQGESNTSRGGDRDKMADDLPRRRSSNVKEEDDVDGVMVDVGSDHEDFDGTGPPTWKLSSKKILGARVFAEFTNGE